MFLIFYFLSSFSKSSENPFQPDSIEQIPSLDQFSNNRISIQSNENDLTCENGKRCKHINVRGTPLFVSVADSTFQDIHNFDSAETDGDGGAIYIRNYYLYCEQTTFNKCSCSAQGGALFIKLDLAAFTDEINCTVVNCTFSSNEALGGGAVFAHGIDGRHFEFDKCVFQDNKSTYEGDTELPTPTQGGGAIFLNNPNGFITDCTFIYNTGIGADITLYFGGLKPKQGIVINNSVFYFNGYDSNPSSFYISKPYWKYDPMSVSVHDCIFTGQIKGEKSHYLDCNEDDTNPNKVLLSNVTFCESSEGQAFQGDKSKYIDENSVISYVCDQYDLPDYPIIDPPTKNEDVTSSETEYLPPTETQSESDEPDDACVSGKRCQFINKKDPPTNITIKDSTFEKIQNLDQKLTDGDGGAIYINNFHILCERTTFQECACINQGGGLYIRENLYSYIDEIKAVIDNCTFSGNEALGGGGIYLYGTEKSILEITKCIFNKNNAKYDGQGPESPGLNYGGGGLNFVARNVLVQNCEFSQNTGIGADISLYLNSNEPKSGVRVLDTTFFFEGNDTNPSSIYLHRANFQTKLSVLFQRCQFSGTITSEVSHFFDCDEDEYGNDKVVLTDVSFCDSNVSQAFQGNYTDYINVDKSTISYECDDTPDLPTIEPTDEFTCVSGKRCDFGQGTINNITTIKIKNSQFNDFYTEGDGGAVYLRNYFVECVHTKFIECKCTEQGGGIFIRNNLYTYSELIAVSIEFSQFKGCQAVGGAGIYVQSSMTTTMFSISSCVFDSNIIIPSATKAIVKDSEIDSTNIGGGGIYLVCPNGFVDSCEFLNNKGIGCDIAVYLPGGVAQKEGIEVKSCMFSFNGNNDNPSSFYLNRGTQFSIKVTLYNCTFAGEITGTVSHFIDCDEYDQSGPQMVLKYVSFCDSDESHAFQGTAKEYIDFDHSIIKYTCGDDFPTENPPIEPTQSSIEEPTQMIPTLPPEPPEEFSCVSGKRCDFGQGTINNITTIKIKSSQFNNFNTEGDGGAVYLRNYHVDCQTSDFFNCRCTEQGGGIFIRNSLYGYTKTVSVSIKECSFIQCQAVGGAGIYAQSSVTTTTFSISSCFFDSNQLLPPPTLPRKPLIKDSETDSTNVGGGGIYLVCPNGEVHSCNFIHNKGIGGDIAVYLPGGVAQTEGIRINSCNFDFHGEDYNPSSFYLLRGIAQSIKVSLENCIFLGEINGKISHYIDSDEFEGNGKMQLKNVSFVNSDISKAFHGNYSDYVDNDNSDFDFPIDPKTHSYTKPQTSSSVITPEHTEIFNSDFYSNNSEINPSGEIEVSVSQNIPDSENPGPDEGNKEDGLSKEATLAIAIVVPLIFVIINLVVIVILVIRKKNRRMMNDNPSNIDLSEKSVSFESQGSSQHSIPENMDVFDDNPFMREMED